MSFISFNARAVPIKDDLETRALRYFLENQHPVSGLVLETVENKEGAIPNATDARRSSIAATGFGLVAIVNAGQRGIIPLATAEAYADRVLKFAKARLKTRNGWFFHFVDWETGERWPRSEYSTIDTAFFIGGALYAALAFPGTDIDRIAHELYENIDFNDMRTNGGVFPTKMQLSLSYEPEDGGYNVFNWKNYAEEMLLILLGIGKNHDPLPPATWTAFVRQKINLPGAENLIGADKPLFEHQYSHLFIDFRNFTDTYGNYFENSKRITAFHKEFCGRHVEFKTFQEGFWGLSAGDRPNGYAAYSPLFFNGTVCPACTVASAMFAPDLVLPAAETWRDHPKYGKDLWEKYGFADGINVDLNWIAPIVHGITVGPVYMSIANMTDETSVWKTFMKSAEIQRALGIAKTQPRPSENLADNGHRGQGEESKPRQNKPDA